MPDVRVSHPTSQQLADYSSGKMHPEKMSAIDDHLASCPDCRRIMENQSPDSFIGKLRATTPRGGTALPRPASVPPPAAASAFSTSLPPRKATSLTDGEVPPELAASSKFQILGKLGQGGMGSVYRAKHNFLGDVVAIKVMNANVVGHPEARSRFLREMQAAGQLKHKNIVRALDAAQFGDLLVLVMEYVDGITLGRLVAQRGPLPVDFSCQCIAHAALGLQHAHEKGMVHRDIKPANLMVTPNGEIKLLDFGLVRGPRGQMDRKNQTRMQTFMGTPEYVAPEQATDARSADIRADIYSLGCTLYCLLAGRPPFQRVTPEETIIAQIQDEPPSLTKVRPEVTTELWTVVVKMMAKDPAKRYQTPNEVEEALRRFVKGKAKAAPRSSDQPSVDVAERISRTPIPAPVHSRFGTCLGQEPRSLAGPDSSYSTKRKEHNHANERKPRPLWKVCAAGIAACVLTMPLLGWGVYSLVSPTKLVAKSDEENGGVDNRLPPSGKSPATVKSDAEKLFEQARECYSGQNGRIDWEEAARLYKQSADQGYLIAQGFLGLLYAWGEGVSLDRAKAGELCLGALGYTKEAAMKGDAVAQQLMGHLCREGLGVRQDYLEAHRWFRVAADKGFAQAQYNLGLLYGQGLGVKRDDSEALRWYRMAASQEFTLAQHAIGCLYMNSLGLEKDYPEAFRWSRKAADKNLSAAQNQIGYMFNYGLGVGKDYEEAMRWYRLAAAQGNPVAQNNIGFMYHEGCGVEQDYKEAMHWYRLAAAQGNPVAEHHIGVMYHEGWGVVKDYEEAMRWYRSTAAKNNSNGQRSIGYMYHYGLGVEKDYEEAMRWYRLAAAQGNPIAQNNIGFMYQNGHGVPRDRNEAQRWYEMAVAQGLESAKKNLDTLR